MYFKTMRRMIERLAILATRYPAESMYVRANKISSFVHKEDNSICTLCVVFCARLQSYKLSFIQICVAGVYDSTGLYEYSY